MFAFSQTSIKHLTECHALLQRLALEVIKTMDCACICGHRGQADQDAAFRIGKSEVQYPNSKHNSEPSEAMDLVPCVDGKITWNSLQAYYFSGRVKEISKKLGISIISGADFDEDNDVNDQKLHDPCHFQLKGVV